MHVTKWYYSTWFIALLFSLWVMVIPLILGFFLLSKQRKEMKELENEFLMKEKEIARLSLLYGLKVIAMDREVQSIKKQEQEILHDIKIQHKRELENEVLIREREIARLTLLYGLKAVAMDREVQSIKKEEQETVQDIRIQHQKELDNVVLMKEKEISRLTLLYGLKAVAVDREIRSIKKEEQEILQDIKIRYQEELENEALIRQKEIAKLSLLYRLKAVAMQRELENGAIHRKYHQLNRLKRIREGYMKEIVVLKDELLYQSFGFYDIQYDLEDSQEYKEMLEKVRLAQKEAVKYDLAVTNFSNWSLNNSLRKGEAMDKRNIKMTIRSFNNECDAVIHKVKFNNVEASEKKIRKAREQIDKLNEYNLIEITDHYLHLKLEELSLAYEFAKKKNEEREEQRRIKELMREDLKAQQEFQERRKILTKEEQHYKNALDTYRNQLATYRNRLDKTNEIFIDDLIREIERTESELKKIEDEKAEIDYRVRNAKAGYVYVISNLGSFGENVYKIGMTRRLEPLDRIRELSGASVPFSFDVHAMIFSEDAPALENELHKTFTEKRVNKVNNRKEFFHVSLKEIEKIVREKHNKPVEFTKLGIAQEYRETLAIERRDSSKLLPVI